MATATYDNVAVAIGRPITDALEQAQVTYWLDSAEMLVTARLGNVALLDQARLVYVETEAVVSRLRNPEGYQSESIDDYTYKFGVDSRRVTILDEWWALLSPKQDQPTGSTRPSSDVDAARWPVQTPPYSDLAGPVGWRLNP